MTSFGTWGFFVTAFISLGMGLFVYAKNRQGNIHQAWLRLSLATFLWSLSTGLMVRASSSLWAFGWARIAQAAFSFIPAFFLQFNLALLNVNGRYEKAGRWILRLACVFAVLGMTPLVVSDLQTELPFQFYPVAGPFYGVFASWFVGSFLVSFWVLLKAYRAKMGAKRNQLKYLILASIVGLGSFLTMFPLAFHISIPPIGQGLLIFYALVSYTIVRWRLMDVSIVVKNTLIYASLYSILVGFFVVVVVFFGQWFFYGPQALDKRVLWMCLVALSIVTGLVRPLDAWLTWLTDRILFQQKFEWQQTLKQASKGMTKVTSADRLLKLMAHFIGMRVRVTHVGLLHRSSDYFTLKVSRGRDRRPVGIAVSRENPLVSWLEEKKEVLTADEVQYWLRSEKLFPHRTVLKRTLAEIKIEMEHLGAVVCIPAFSKSQMLGILVLGEKLSGDPYSREDLDVLSTLANEGAIALENANLYGELYQRMHQIEDLYQREHSLFIHTAIALAAAVDARDPYTHGHTERCTQYAMTISDEMESQPEMSRIPRFKEMLKIAALLHDIGKIGVPDEILRKKGGLTPKESKKMQEHPLVGAIILQPIKGMEEVAKAVKAHQEQYDGKGYPDNLRGTEIPLMARIIAVADTFDAMTTDRPYRKHFPESVAVKEIETCSGTQFDPVVVQAFLRAYQKGRITLRPVEAESMLG
ncbi:MAG: HD domain-containing protein [Candidatus Omnitrophica bacterium]|nr:HD domain-containing protein [Candidatus Omnitrophota bacterium]